MPWVELFAVFAACHLVGDFVLQTEWQAQTKRGGLGRDPDSRRALFTHTLNYTLCYLPALIWVGDEVSAGAAVGTAGLIGVPHLVQDDMRLLRRYMAVVKHTDPDKQPSVAVMVDQSLHVVALLLTALLIGQ